MSVGLSQSAKSRSAKAPLLDALFCARSVAVIGVSEDAAKLGRVVLNNVIRGGFQGAIHPVGRSGGSVDGLTCYANIRDVPTAPDVAFLALPATATAAALRDCAAAGVKVAIVGAAGYAEDANEEGIARQRELEAIAAATGIHVVGPNCNGVYVTGSRMALGFNAAHARVLPAGGIAVLSHSGALFDSMMRLMESLGGGLSVFVSAGNQVDLDVLDYMESLLDDDNTRVFALLLDAISDGERFRHLAVEARRRGKAVVALKIGISATGARAATAHSSRLTGEAGAYAALFAASGVAQTFTLDGFITAAVLLDRYGYVSGGVGGLTTSGAGASLLADVGERYGLRFPDYTEATLATIGKYQRFSQLANPTDAGVFGNLAHADAIYPAIAADAGVGVFLAQIHVFPGASGIRLADCVVAAREQTGKPVIVLVPGDVSSESRARYTERDVPVLTDSDSALQAVAALLTPMPQDIATVAPDVELQRKLRAQPGTFSEPDSLALLAGFGVATVPTQACHSADEALVAAEKIGWPIVLKGVIEGVAHKSDLGLVHVGIANAEALRTAFAGFGPNAKAIVQPLLHGAIEAIAGVTRNADTGPILLAGLGGIYAEALRDIAMWSLPVSRADIETRLAAGALGRTLHSERWKFPGAFAALVDLLMQLQQFALAAGDALEAVDVNPVVLGRNGVVAVDALVVSALDQSESP